MRRITLLVLASGLMDLTAYIFFFLVSVQARERHGFSPWQSLLFGAGYDVVYASVCIATAGASDGRARHRYLAAGGLAFLGAAALAILLPGLAGLAGAIALLAVGLSQYWPNMQARLGDLSPGSTALNRTLGAFNLSWCVGKSLGFVIAARLLAADGPARDAVLARLDLGYALSGGLAAVSAALAVWGSLGPTPAPPEDPADAGRDPGGYLPAARLANFVGWGGSALLVWAVYQRAAEIHLSADVAGFALFCVFAAEAATNTGLWALSGWRYRLSALLVLQMVGAAGFVVLAFADTPALFAGGAALTGVGLGMAYYASIFYSLDAGVARAHRTAVHETILGLGGITVPLAGAGAAWMANSGAAPFGVAAALILLSLPIQVVLVRRRPPG